MTQVWAAKSTSIKHTITLKRSTKPIAQKYLQLKTRVENVQFLTWRTFFVGKNAIQSTNEVAFGRTVRTFAKCLPVHATKKQIIIKRKLQLKHTEGSENRPTPYDVVIFFLHSSWKLMYHCGWELCFLTEGGEQANGSADFENIFARISDSKRDFNGFPDSAIAADCGFIHFLCPDFGLCV